MRKHGYSNLDNRTYRTWCQMRTRCRSDEPRYYPHYKGKGIRVCERWDDFSKFLQDMGERPEGKTLDRIDNSLGYSPDNCRWATVVEQANNKSSNTLLTFAGETLNVSQWARKTGIPRHTLFLRIRSGWPVDKLLTKEPIKKNHMVTFRGETKSLHGWANALGLNYRTLLARFNSGKMTTEQMLTAKRYELRNKL